MYPKESNQAETDDEDESMELVEENASDAELAKGYEYLLGMKIWSLTFERAKELRRQKTEKAEDVEKLEGTSPEAIWMTDLEAIEEALDERDVELNAELKRESTIQNHDPREVIANIKKMINGEEPELMHPHFAGYTGEVRLHHDCV